MDDSRLPHLDIDRLVAFLLEGSHITPAAHAHLMGCAQCRASMLAIALEEVGRQRPSRSCQARERLFREWREAAEMYVKTLVQLTETTDQTPDSELLALGRIAEVARKLTAQVRTELEEHIATHRCY